MNQTLQRPSRRGKRPSAYDVSFGSEDPDDSTAGTASDATRKRDRGDAVDADTRGSKRRNLDSVPKNVRKYDPRPYEVKETKELLVFGEEPHWDDGKKRVRILSRFTFFDGKADSETYLNMVSLDIFGPDGTGGDRLILGAGFAIAKPAPDEDGDQVGVLDEEADQQCIRTSRVLGFWTKYWESDSPFYIETDHAIYELDVLRPSKRYRSMFSPFWRMMTVLRSIISTGNTKPEQVFHDFLEEYEHIYIFGQPMTQNELWDSQTHERLRVIMETVPRGDAIRASNVFRHFRTHLAPVQFKPVGKKKVQDNRQSIFDTVNELEAGNGNPDLAVLRMKTKTTVTRRIGDLALPLFREHLSVVGPRPRIEPTVPTDDLAERLKQFLIRAQTRDRRIRQPEFRSDQRIGRSRWLKHILIDGVKYEAGDTVLFYPVPENDILPNPDDLPSTDTLADHFWFAKIIHINEEHEMVHVQWFEHSSKTLLQELGHSQELFLINQCDTQPLRLIIGKVETHYIKPDQSLANIPSHDFFYRYMWDDYEGRFTDIDLDALAAAARERPGDNCAACEIHSKFDETVVPEKIHLGIRWLGADFHLDDCVLLKADEGPCYIGHIIKFNPVGRDNYDVVVRLFGRIDKIGCRPDRELKDERHLFYTDDVMTTPYTDLIEVCYVVVKEDMPELETWLAMSPNRFYVKYRFPSLAVTSWGHRRRMRWSDLPICGQCLRRKDMKEFKGMKAFLEKEAPLRVLDPFAGIGSFAMALEESGCFKLTHAVEISPSAAETLRKNASADVKVYNQDSNRVLEHAILTHAGKDPDVLGSIVKDSEPLPPPPKPGDIDCVIAGFPCQTHSTLNMYQKANDGKSNLIFTVLSYVDFLKPLYCIFENVRGFLQYNLRSRQYGKYSVKGGIPMGGIKFVAAALLDMGYQFQCALLQAGHYGTPQTRVRFFLIASKRGLELPEFPQPTHDFPLADALEMKFPDGLALSPMTTLTGVAPHRYVSVHDAISDLPKFDWKNPNEKLTRRQMEERGIKECRDEAAWCGFQGPNVPYEHEPRTRFQQRCRSRPTLDIQQYTRTVDPCKVERVVTIPVEADADYRSLPPHLWQWQISNPSSSVAKTGFKGGYYGRVQRDEWFQTTVTNIDPMAKQSRVIHPYSKRIVTVRELARSQGFPDHFVFYAINNRVLTMHRQIGNAIPWPVSMAIARKFRETLYKNWEKRNPVEEPPEVEFSGDSDDGMDVDLN